MEYPEGTLVALKPGETIKLKLIEKEQVTANSVRVRFELPSPEHILGLPVGQHATMTIDGVSRPYTPISRDADKGFMDLLVKIYDNGALTQKLNAVEIGSTVDFEGPKVSSRTPLAASSPRKPATGDVAKKSCKSIAMIAGGTGITPMLQVIRQIFNDVGDTTRVNVLFANVSSADILMKKELDELASAHKNLTVHYAIDADEPGWTGEVGYISAEMMKKCELFKPSGLMNKLFASADKVDKDTPCWWRPPAMVKRPSFALDALKVSTDSRIFF